MVPGPLGLTEPLLSVALGMSVRSHPHVRLCTAISRMGSCGAREWPIGLNSPTGSLSATGYAVSVRFQKIL